MTRLTCVPKIVGSLNHGMGFPLSEHDVADLNQDVLVAVWRKRSKFSGQAKLETWVHRFCFLEFMNQVRKLGSHRQLQTSDALLSDLASEDGSDEAMVEYELLERSLQQLGPPHSGVIRLKHFEDRTFREIADLLDVSQNTVKAHYYRGLAWLRQRLLRHHREATE